MTRDEFVPCELDKVFDGPLLLPPPVAVGPLGQGVVEEGEHDLHVVGSNALQNPSVSLHRIPVHLQPNQNQSTLPSSVLPLPPSLSCPLSVLYLPFLSLFSALLRLFSALLPPLTTAGVPSTGSLFTMRPQSTPRRNTLPPVSDASLSSVSGSDQNLRRFSLEVKAKGEEGSQSGGGYP